MPSKFMRPFYSFIAVALALMSASSFASTVTYTSSASFLVNVAPGAYTENFDGLSNPAPTAFSSGGFSFDISAPDGLYASGDFLGTNQIDDALTITFGAGIRAFGANFFFTDINPDFQAGLVTLTLSDGTVETFTPSSLFDSYRGFTSDIAFTSLVISAPGQSLYASLDNLTVGTMPNTVPEPTTLVLAGLALAGLLVSRRQRLN